MIIPPQVAFYVNLHRAVIGPSATLTGRWRPDIDLRRLLTGTKLNWLYIAGTFIPLRDRLVLTLFSSSDYQKARISITDQVDLLQLTAAIEMTAAQANSAEHTNSSFNNFLFSFFYDLCALNTFVNILNKT